MWARCRFPDTEVDFSKPGCISMMCHRARHLIGIASVDTAVKCIPDGNTIVKGICSVL